MVLAVPRLILSALVCVAAIGIVKASGVESSPSDFQVSKYQLLDLSDAELAAAGIRLNADATGHWLSPETLVFEPGAPGSPPPTPVPSSYVGFGDWLGYNSTSSDMTWIAAGNDLGIFSLQNYPSLSPRDSSGLNAGIGFHFLDGPNTTDLPPRLFDFELAYQTRELHTDHWMLDLRFGLGAFSDFEGSARKGVRFPGHAVSYYQVDPWMVTVLGVEVLDRDDITLLPVMGIVWRPHENWLVECVFPKPKIQWQFHPHFVFYVSGELGGGTWAIERVDGRNDNVTYSDLRLACGLAHIHAARETVLEFGCAADRSLEFRSRDGNQDLDSAFMLRLRSHF